VLVKGGVHLENLGRVKAVAFDKTGTLTRGHPDVTDVFPLDHTISPERVLELAAAVEKGSTHPIASAIVEEARHRNLTIPDAHDVQQIAGIGMSATVDGCRVYVGKAAPSRGTTASDDAVERFAADGKTTVLVSVDDVPAAVIALADRPREAAAAAVRRLKDIGIDHVIMLTGDRRTVAASIASELGVDEFHGDLMPQDKLAKVRELEKQ
jgi:P-type E1-E2 ATPase